MRLKTETLGLLTHRIGAVLLDIATEDGTIE